MGEFSEKDVRDGLRFSSLGGASGPQNVKIVSADYGMWKVISEPHSKWVGTVTTCDVVDLVRGGVWSVPEGTGNGRDLSPPTQRSVRRFDGVTVRCDAIERTGHVSWCESTADYFVRWDDDDGLRVCCHYAERDLDAELSRDNWRIVSWPQAESPKAQTPRFVQPHFEITALWSQLPPFPHCVPDHVHPSAEGIAMFERSPADKPVSPREASRRDIDETVRGLRGQLFAAAVQAVLVSACTEGRSGERILSRADIDSMVAACRAWEDCRSKVAPGRRTLTPEQAAKCWEAATKVGLWLGGSGEVYERARTL